MPEKIVPDRIYTELTAALPAGVPVDTTQLHKFRLKWPLRPEGTPNRLGKPDEHPDVVAARVDLRAWHHAIAVGKFTETRRPNGKLTIVTRSFDGRYFHSGREDSTGNAIPTHDTVRESTFTKADPPLVVTWLGISTKGVEEIKKKTMHDYIEEHPRYHAVDNNCSKFADGIDRMTS